ncbi:MAG TPA: PDZ domain-containing protein [Acidimicrobiia bacterium]|nr:PDZ domain-containing protein [Acidimicrobiia bacterium]
MNRRFSALAVIAIVSVACAPTPPERSALPEVDEVLDPPAECGFLVGDPQGVLVQEVVPASAAEGILLAGDVIVSFDDRPTPDSEALLTALSDRAPGDVVEVGFLRDDRETRGTLTLGANPDDNEGDPRIGVMIRTRFRVVPASEATAELTPGPLTRPISIAGTIYLFDPESHSWQRTALDVSDQANWVATTAGLYAIEAGVVTDLANEEEVPHDRFEDWDPIRLVGSIGPDLMLVVTQDLNDGTGRVAVGISRFDPRAGATSWVEPVVDGFGIPVFALGSPDTTSMVVVGVAEGGSDITGVEIRDEDGSVSGSRQLVDLGTPVGWMDEDRVLFRTDVELATVLDVAGGSTEQIVLESAVGGIPLFPVGDSRNVLAVDGQTLLLEDLTVTGDLRVVAENCIIGRVGEPGWGLAEPG